jgi:glucose/mannose-6-phosphate isomerase
MNLNDIKEISNFDSGRVAESIVLLPDQIKDIIKQSKKVKLPSAYSKVNKIVVSGMGGSNLGARIIASAFKEELKVPMSIEAGYVVPNFVDQKTLYIISSYSGSTEEPLSTYAEARKRKAKIVVLSAASSKNPLHDLMVKDKLPGLIFEPIANPSNQPRMALGYAVFGFLAILSKAGLIKVSGPAQQRVIDDLRSGGKKLDIGVNDNPAKRVALELAGKQIFLCGGDFLEGSLHAMRNQFCENSKNTASYLVLPDMNHYALESLANPLNNKDSLAFLFFKSGLYRPAIGKRLDLTKTIVEKNGIKALVWELKSKTKLGQAAEILQVGSWITFYLAFVNGVDPVKIPWVDWFKEQLAK